MTDIVSRNVVAASMLETLLWPATPGELYAASADGRELVVRGRSAHPPLLTLDGFDDICRSNHIQDVHVVIERGPVTGRAALADATWSTPHDGWNTALDAYANGHALTLQRLEQLYEPALALCAALQAEWGRQVGASASLLPSGADVAPHAAERLIVQLEGETKWTLGAAAAVRSIELAPGDLLYLPPELAARGQCRDRSLYVTLEVAAVPLLSAVSEQLLSTLEACLVDPAFRADAPLTDWNERHDPARRSELLTTLWQRLAASCDSRSVRTLVDHAAPRLTARSSRARQVLSQLDSYLPTQRGGLS